MKTQKWFTLIEIMIVVSIIGILWAILFPSMTQYLASARDSNRVVDIRSLAWVFQVYRNVNEALPDNFSWAINNYCTSEILAWPNWVWIDRQYRELSANFNVIPSEKRIIIPMNPCTSTWSYVYNRLTDAASTQYAILAARMETVNSITYLTGSDFTSAMHLSKILRADQLKWFDLANLSGSIAPIYHMVVY